MQRMRWWNRATGRLARAMFRRASSEFPRRYHDGIQLLVGDINQAPASDRFFSRTIEALNRAASTAPEAFVALRKDLRRVVLWSEGSTTWYQRHLLAAVVPTRIAFESSPEEYAAWLLYASGIPLGEQQAQARAEAYLAALGGAERNRTAEWLARVKGGSP